MPGKAKKSSPSKVDQLVAQANQRAAEAGIEIEPEKYSLEWYRADWPARKRAFIENEIKIKNAFEHNREVPLILNDAQIELNEASLESSVAIIEAQLKKDVERGRLSEEEMEAAMSRIRSSTGVSREDLDPTQTDVSLKCRRIGGTTYYEADYLADAIVEGNHYVRFVAHDPDLTDSILDTLKFMYDHLRPEIKAEAKYNSKSELYESYSKMLS